MRMAIIGSGLLATQIALQAASRGFDVTVYNHRGDFTRFDQLLEWVGSQEESLRGRPLTRNGSLVDAIGDADIVLEAAAEDLGIKQTLFREIEKLARPDALLLTNSSNLLPAEISEGMAAPLRLVAMHFANMIWRHNVVEVMGQEDTPPELLERVADLGRAMGMAPVVIPKPVRGYLLNALLIPFLDAGLALWTGGHASPAGIDTVWTIGTGAPLGPFGILDVVGFRVAARVLAQRGAKELADRLQAEADAGRGGAADGTGFYLYDASGAATGPNPAWES